MHVRQIHAYASIRANEADSTDLVDSDVLELVRELLQNC